MDDRGIGFRDLEFEHAFAKVAGRDGIVTWRWVPVGMPRVSTAMEKCVFYLFGLDPKTGRRVGPGGTGFLVARQSKSLGGMVHVYAISNKHVVNPFSIVRINTKKREIRYIDFDPSEWIVSDSDDLAAIDITDHIPGMTDRISFTDDITWVWERDFIDHRELYIEVGIGDDTIMLGLFADHDGGGAINLPVGRFGSVAALPDRSVPVRLDASDPFVRPAFLNDMRSRSGFSGSPVWSWSSPFADVNAPDSRSLRYKLAVRSGPSLRLIGVHRGQFRENAAPVERGNPARGYKTPDEIEIASSMTVVIPAWEITRLLDSKSFEDQRAARDKREDRIDGNLTIERFRRAIEGGEDGI